MKKFWIFFLIIFCFSCKDEYFLDADIDFRFSENCIDFDTVFSDVRSKYQVLKIFNDSNKNVEFDIFLEENSPFRINVDGQFVNSNAKLKLQKKDSILLFVDFFDTKNQNENFCSSLKIVNGNIVQNVDIKAFKLNVDIIKELNKDLIDGNFLIDGKVKVDKNINIKNSNLFFTKNSSLEIFADLFADSVNFRMAEFDSLFNSVKGYWSGLNFCLGSKENILQNCSINNCEIGICKKFNEEVCNFTIKNCSMKNFTYSALYFENCNIKVDSLWAENSNNYLLYLNKNGIYDFEKLYLIEKSANQNKILTINNDESFMELSASFSNSVVYSNFSSAMDLMLNTNIKFLDCFLKYPEIQNESFKNCVFNNFDGVL